MKIIAIPVINDKIFIKGVRFKTEEIKISRTKKQIVRKATNLILNQADVNALCNLGINLIGKLQIKQRTEEKDMNNKFIYKDLLANTSIPRIFNLESDGSVSESHYIEIKSVIIDSIKELMDYDKYLADDSYSCEFQIMLPKETSEDDEEKFNSVLDKKSSAILDFNARKAGASNMNKIIALI